MYSMNKTKNRKKRKNMKKTKKLVGGYPNIITVKGYYDDDNSLLYYRILHNKSFNKIQQQKYADKHKVFYSTKPSSFIEEISELFDVKPKLIKKKYEKFFKLPGIKSPSSEYETIVVHDAGDINKIKTANQIIENIHTKTFTNTPTTKYDNTNMDIVIKEYKIFITMNEILLLDGVKGGKEMLNSPVFLKIIGKKYEIFNDPDNNLDKMDLDEISVLLQ